MTDKKISQLPALPVAATGAELVPVVQSGVTYQANLTQLAAGVVFVNVKSYGAIGDGVTDDTVAIQAAVNAGAGTVYFPSGTYKISAEITITSGGTVLRGASRNTAILSQTTMGGKILNISGAFCGIQSLRLVYAGTPTIGGTAVVVSGPYVTLTDFLISNSFIGVSWVTGAVAGKMTDFDLFNYESSGVTIENTNDVFISNFIMNAGNATRGSLGGIRLLNKTEAIVVTEGDILGGTYSLTTDATVYGIGTRPAYNRFANVYFDSAANAAIISKCVETDFIGCWFSNGRSGGGQPGVALSTCEAVRFTNTTFFNSGSHGVNVASTAIDTVFVNCNADSNSVTAGAGVAHGFNFASGTTTFKLIGCTASNGLFTGTQGYGISIGASCDNFIISDCTLIGNATGALLDGSSATATKYITSNLGLNVSSTAGSSTVGADEATDTHAIKGAATVLANSASSALKVTQTGAGNAFTVEDVASDTTPFVIDADGRIAQGGGTVTEIAFMNNRDIGGAASSYVFRSAGVGQTTATTNIISFSSALSTVASAYTLTNMTHFRADQGTIGATSTVTNQHGFRATSGLVGATNNYGFYAEIASAAGRWNFYSLGTANNAFLGNSSFGKVTAPTVAVDTTSLGTSLITNTAATYTVLTTDHTIIQTTAGSTYTLPAAASFTGRVLHLVTQFAGAVISASSNVVPIAGGAAGTAILAATAGKFATLQSNGTNWVIIAAN